MRIKGTSNCFESRTYEIDGQTGWKIVRSIINALGTEIVSESPEQLAMTVQQDSTIMSIVVKDLADSCEIIADASVKGFRLFDWGGSGKLIDRFFLSVEQKLAADNGAVSGHKFCTQCAAPLAANAKFCQNCGSRV